MNSEEFFKMCTSRDWSELFSFQCSSVKDLSTKILVSAIIQEHHPDKTIAKEKGLNACWGKRLSANPVSPMLSMMTSAVDLGDFAGAYLLAKSKDLNDQKVADRIADFVKANKMQLGQYLTSDQVPQEQKDLIAELFEDLILTKAQKEAYFKKHFAQQAKQKISFLQAKDQVNMDMAKIFAMSPSDFQVTFQKKSSMQGIDSGSLSSEGNISFKNAISNKLIQTLVEALKNLDISANYFNMSFYTGRDSARGIQLWSQPEEIHKKLSEFATFIAEKKSNEKISANNQTPGFFKAAEIVQEIKTLAAEPMNENKIKPN